MVCWSGLGLAPNYLCAAEGVNPNGFCRPTENGLDTISIWASAHLNTSIGGMGLNGGIHDAANLTGKLAQVWKGEADNGLLDL